jgi:hypothetical protein
MPNGAAFCACTCAYSSRAACSRSGRWAASFRPPDAINDPEDLPPSVKDAIGLEQCFRRWHLKRPKIKQHATGARIGRPFGLHRQLVLDRVTGNFADCVPPALANLAFWGMPATCALCVLVPIGWCTSFVTRTFLCA